MTDSKKLDLILAEIQDIKRCTENLEQRAGNIEQRTENIDRRVGDIDRRVENVNQRVENINQRVENIEQLAGNIDQRVESLEQRTTNIELTLENETNRNIRLIAEGHLDLSRKLDDALKIECEKELLLIRVNSLENEIRRIKERAEEIA